MLDLDRLEDTRRSICNRCEHYDKKKDACQFIALRTGKLGLLSHENGVRNPKSRCPYFYFRKWNFVPSFWAYEINRLVFPLLPIHVREYTIAHYLSPFSIMERAKCREKDLNGNYTAPKRSEIMSRVRAINAYPNEYQHTSYLRVDYETGELFE